MACCKSCAQSAVAGKRKRASGLGQIFSTMKGGKSRSKMLISAAKVAGGIAAGQLVKKMTAKMMKDSENPEYVSSGIQIVGGIVLASLGANTQELALGMAASGMADIVKKVANIGSIGGVGMIPYSGSGSSTVPGVAGPGYGYGPSGGIMVVD